MLEKGFEICSKLTIKTPERRQWRRFGVFIVNFEYVFAGRDLSNYVKEKKRKDNYNEILLNVFW